MIYTQITQNLNLGILFSSLLSLTFKYNMPPPPQDYIKNEPKKCLNTSV